MSGLEAGAANWLAALWGAGSEGVPQQPHPLGHQIGVTFIRMPKNIFRFRRIAKILNSLPDQYPIWVVRYLKWVLKSENRVIVRRQVPASPTHCLRRYNSRSW